MVIQVEARLGNPAGAMEQLKSGVYQRACASMAPGANTPLPTNRYVGVNKGRINDPEINGWVEKYSLTIPWDERMQLASQLIHRITDEVIYMPTIYRADAWLVANRVKNIDGLVSSWNVHEWEVG